MHHHGGFEQLRYEDTPAPKLGSPGDVIVRLEAAAVNWSDLQIGPGTDKRSSPPRIPGSDGAGVITAIGSGVKALSVGDRVCLYPQDGCAQCRACRSDRQELCEQPQRLGDQVDGTYGEYARVPERNCFSLPAGYSFEEAAAIPVAYLSAWRMLITDAELKPGEWVLIRAIGDSISNAALQLALHLGAHVIVTADSAEKLARAKALGAAHGIDESQQDFPPEVRRLTAKRGVDLVVDGIGGDHWIKSFAALARGGRLVTCGASAGANPVTDLRRIFWNNLKVFGSSLGSRDELRRALDFLQTTGTKPIIDKVYALDDAAQAHRRLASGENFGKIVLRIDRQSEN